jgi:predicted signal transduction protein with EAL and GGDEF domain
VISIQKEMRNGEGLQQLLDKISLCYQGTVADARQYAIDFGALTPPYQAGLDTIVKAMAEQEWNEANLDQFKTNVQTSFRSFKDKAEKQLYRLRNDLNQTTTSLSAVLKALEYEEPTQTLRTQVNRINDLQKVDDIRQLKSALRVALSQLEKSVEETEKRNRMVISDLQAEISTLQNQVSIMAEQKVGERTLRAVLDERLSGEPFVLLVVRLAGLGRLKTKHGEPGVTAVMNAAQQRLSGVMGPALAIGLWDQQTLGMLNQPTDAPSASLTRTAINALTGKYDVLGETVTVQANAGVLEWRPPDDRAAFLRRLQDLLHVLRT